MGGGCLYSTTDVKGELLSKSSIHHLEMYKIYRPPIDNLDTNNNANLIKIITDIIVVIYRVDECDCCVMFIVVS